MTMRLSVRGDAVTKNTVLREKLRQNKENRQKALSRGGAPKEGATERGS